MERRGVRSISLHTQQVPPKHKLTFAFSASTCGEWPLQLSKWPLISLLLPSPLLERRWRGVSGKQESLEQGLGLLVCFVCHAIDVHCTCGVNFSPLYKLSMVVLRVVKTRMFGPLITLKWYLSALWVSQLLDYSFCCLYTEHVHTCNFSTGI